MYIYENNSGLSGENRP